MNEIIFLVEEPLEGGIEAKALGQSIFRDGDSLEELKENIKEGIKCRFDDEAPKVVRLHMVREEVFAA